MWLLLLEFVPARIKVAMDLNFGEPRYPNSRSAFVLAGRACFSFRRSRLFSSRKSRVSLSSGHSVLCDSYAVSRRLWDRGSSRASTYLELDCDVMGFLNRLVTIIFRGVLRLLACDQLSVARVRLGFICFTLPMLFEVGAVMAQESLLSSVREARSEWKSARGRIEGKYIDYIAGTRAVHYDFLFDGEKLRIDETIRSVSSSEHSRLVNIISPDRHIRYTDMDTSTPQQAVSSISDLRKSPRPPSELVADPRHIGLAASSFEGLRWQQPEYSITGSLPKWIPGKLQYEEWNGMASEVMNWSRKNTDDQVDDTLKARIVPSLAYAVVQVKARSVVRDVDKLIEMSQAVDTVYSEQAGGKYFPSSYIYKVTKGDVVQDEENCVIHLDSFNEPIPQQEFQVAGIKPHPGARFAIYPNIDGQGDMVWNGDELKFSASSSSVTPPLKSPPASKTLFLILTAIVFALIAAVCIFRISRGRAVSK